MMNHCTRRPLHDPENRKEAGAVGLLVPFIRYGEPGGWQGASHPPGSYLPEVRSRARSATVRMAKITQRVK